MWQSNSVRRQQFIEHVERHRSELVAYCRHLVWDQNEHEDVIQTVLMTAFAKFSSFESGTNFRAWIFRIATLIVFNFNRCSAQHRERVVNLSEEALDMVAELQREYAYEELLSHPDKILAHVGDELHDALMSLTPHERSVFLLKTVVELSCKEISEILKMPMGSVMGYLARGRGKLRNLLCEYAKQYGFLSREVRQEKADDV